MRTVRHATVGSISWSACSAIDLRRGACAANDESRTENDCVRPRAARICASASAWIRYAMTSASIGRGLRMNAVSEVQEARHQVSGTQLPPVAAPLQPAL